MAGGRAIAPTRTTAMLARSAERVRPGLGMTGNMTTMTVRIWGARGTIACAGPATQRYGGNTSCVEVRCGERVLILDAGTGLRGLGEALMAQRGRPQGGGLTADLLLTHCHFDHMLGLPVFAPAFVPGNRFRLWAGHLLP